jgi:co-chaperonin GroES (HSP10)
MDPLPEVKGGIVLVQGSAVNTIRTGIVRKVGPGRYAKGTNKRVNPGLEVGERVGFLRWHLEHKTGKQVTSFLEGEEDNVGLIRVADILFAYAGDIQIG